VQLRVSRVARTKGHRALVRFLAAAAAARALNCSAAASRASSAFSSCCFSAAFSCERQRPQNMRARGGSGSAATMRAH
jgi:hypothetical protein